MSVAFIPYDSPTLHLGCNPVGIGAEPRVGCGLAGGYTPINLYHGAIRNSSYLDKLAHGEVPRNPLSEGKIQVFPLLKTIELNENDLFLQTVSGGAGYGDPIDRNPELVLKDVKTGEVSIEKAKQYYGVIVDPQTLEVDVKKTKELRQSIIEERLRVGKK